MHIVMDWWIKVGLAPSLVPNYILQDWIWSQLQDLALVPLEDCKLRILYFLWRCFLLFGGLDVPLKIPCPLKQHPILAVKMNFKIVKLSNLWLQVNISFYDKT